MTKNYSVLRNSLYSVGAWGIPVVVNIVSIPYIVSRLGNDGYGIWALVMAVIGYFTLLDMNLVKGGIRYLAEYYAKDDRERVQQVITLGLMAYAGIGVAGMVLMSICTEAFLLSILKIPGDLVPTARAVLHIGALGFLANMIQTYLASIPKAIHRFDVSSKIEICVNVALTMGTVTILWFGFGLVEVVMLRVGGTVLASVVFYMAIQRLIPYFKMNVTFGRELIRKLTTFSFYTFLGRVGTTSSNELTKVVIGVVLGTSAVTVFSVPLLLVSRVMNVSIRVSAVVFPISSELGSTGERAILHGIYLKMARYLFFLNSMFTVLFLVYSYEILIVWMGSDFAGKAHTILVLIAVGMLFDTSTNLPSLINDGLNYPHITGFFAIARGAFGLVLVIVGGYLWGLLGVGWAYLISSVLTALCFNLYVHKHTIQLSFMKVIRQCYLKTAIFAVLVGVVLILTKRLLGVDGTSLLFLTVGAVLAIIGFGVFGYMIVVEDELRKRIKDFRRSKVRVGERV